MLSLIWAKALDGGNMKKIMIGLWSLVLVLTLCANNPQIVSASNDTNLDWISLLSPQGVIEERIQDETRYIQLSSHEANNNSDKSAFFTKKNGWKMNGKEVGTSLTFIPLSNPQKTRLNIMLFFKDFNNYISIGYNASGWFWQYAVDGQGTYGNLGGTLPLQNESYSLDITFKDNKFILKGTQSEGEQTVISDYMFDAGIVDALASYQDIAIRLGQFGSESSSIMIKSTDQTDIPKEIIREPRETVDIYDDYEFKLDFESESLGETNVLFPMLGDVKQEIVTTESGQALKINFDSTSGKQIATFERVALMDNYTIEADMTVKGKANRFGFAMRAVDSKTFATVSTGDETNLFFSEHFGSKSSYSGMAEGPRIEEGKTFKLSAKVSDSTLALSVDGKEVFSNIMGNIHSNAAEIGIFKDRGTLEVLLDNVVIRHIPQQRPTDPIEGGSLTTIKSDAMTVTIDEAFPRVVKYELNNGIIMHGQPSILNTLVLNGIDVIPEVSMKRLAENQVEYLMKVRDEAHKLNVDLTAVLSVVGESVTFEVTKIQNNNPTPYTNETTVRTIEIPNHSLVSVRSNETNAQLMATRMSTDTTVSGDTLVPVDSQLRRYNQPLMYGFISNGEIAAGIYSNSQYSAGGGSNDFTRVNARVQEYLSYNSMGLQSSPWYYHRDVMYDDDTLELPVVKVVLSEDRNNDQAVNWQDAAIAYRDIMYVAKGAEDVPDLVAYRIAMNFGSHAQNPFLTTLDGIKKIGLHTDGLGQSILLKGYGSEGHDSGHLDYANIGSRIGGVAEFRKLLDRSVDYGARIGIHVNASETYPESKYFSESLLRKNVDGSYNYGWNWIDQGINIDAAKDLAGYRRERFEELGNVLGPNNNLDFIYVDVWGNGQSGDNSAWTSHQLAKEINDQGWRLGGEWGYAFEPDTTFSHWAADLTYGGYKLKGINSNVARFIYNHQKDVWIADYPAYTGAAIAPLLGGYDMKDFEGWQGRNDYNGYIVNLFENNVPTKFVQHFTVNQWVNGEAVTMTNQDGLSYEWIPEMKVTLIDAMNNVLKIERGSNDFKNDYDGYTHRTMTLNDKVVLNGETYLIPWSWDATGKTLSNADEKLYHFNKTGGKTEWELPSNWNVSSVMYYRLTETGKELVSEIPVVNGKVTLTAEANMPYSVYRGTQKQAEMTYGEGAHVVDPGFNSQNLDAWTQKGDTDSITIEKSQASNDMLVMRDNDSLSSVSQVLTDLTPGADYVAYVGVDNRSDAKATLSIITEEDRKEAYTYRSIAENYVKAYEHNTKSSTVEGTSYFQNMFVFFKAPQTGDVTLQLTREPGSGTTYFDGVRITENEGNPFDEAGNFFNDFENNAQGIYPFVVSDIEGVEDNRTHLSEKHDPYTQRGWNNKRISDVIEGDWSLKTNGLTGRQRRVYQTIPQMVRFEPGQKYTVSFDYEMGSDYTYAVMIGDGLISNHEQMLEMVSTRDKEGPQRMEFEITGSETGQTWFAIYSTATKADVEDASNKDINFRGYNDFILDNISIINQSNITPPLTEYSIARLRTLIAQFEALEVYKYTVDSYTLLETRVKQGVALLALIDERGLSNKPSQSEIDSIIMEIERGFEKLELRDFINPIDPLEPVNPTDPSNPELKPEGSTNQENSSLPATGVATNSMVFIFGSMMSVLGIVLCFIKFERRSNRK